MNITMSYEDMKNNYLDKLTQTRLFDFRWKHTEHKEDFMAVTLKDIGKDISSQIAKRGLYQHQSLDIIVYDWFDRNLDHAHTLSRVNLLDKEGNIILDWDDAFKDDEE